jgi:hypothetical protein
MCNDIFNIWWRLINLNRLLGSKVKYAYSFSKNEPKGSANILKSDEKWEAKV